MESDFSCSTLPAKVKWAGLTQLRCVNARACLRVHCHFAHTQTQVPRQVRLNTLAPILHHPLFLFRSSRFRYRRASFRFLSLSSSHTSLRPVRLVFSSRLQHRLDCIGKFLASSFDRSALRTRLRRANSSTMATQPTCIPSKTALSDDVQLLDPPRAARCSCLDGRDVLLWNRLRCTLAHHFVDAKRSFLLWASSSSRQATDAPHPLSLFSCSLSFAAQSFLHWPLHSRRYPFRLIRLRSAPPSLPLIRYPFIILPSAHHYRLHNTADSPRIPLQLV